MEHALCLCWELQQLSWRGNPRPMHTSDSREGFCPRSVCSGEILGICSGLGPDLGHLHTHTTSETLSQSEIEKFSIAFVKQYSFSSRERFQNKVVCVAIIFKVWVLPIVHSIMVYFPGHQPTGSRFTEHSETLLSFPLHSIVPL